MFYRPLLFLFAFFHLTFWHPLVTAADYEQHMLIGAADLARLDYQHSLILPYTMKHLGCKITIVGRIVSLIMRPILIIQS